MAVFVMDKRKKPLNVDHIVPRARGGSNRVGNLAIACEPCNQEQGAWPIQDFLHAKPDVLGRVLAHATTPLAAAAAVNATRWALVDVLKSSGLPLELCSGGRTKFNRARLGVPKQHGLDAACLGGVAALHG